MVPSAELDRFSHRREVKIRPMFGWAQRRREFLKRVVQRADELIARHGESAYDVARDHRIRTLRAGERGEHKFWCAVARTIADRIGRVVGLDTATRYLEASPTPSETETDLDGTEAAEAVRSPPGRIPAERSPLRLVVSND
ncbi:hypothetical protein [Chelatococcus sambhunathii]|uniref:hypothetical protein n=1 Tax=Chelatococcus sambhunathii TaxID=363953 RepID=UPI0011476427|nr:hypothetical protein [Chelatococcus sambhunathii]